MKKIGILTSGGDAPGMNGAIRAAVRCGLDKGMEVYGIQRGYEGLLEGEIRRLESRDVGDILQRGGTILHTARSARFKEDKWIDHAAKMLRTFGIEGLIVIGGDGSFNGGLQLAKRGIKVMGVPGTIDNDMAYTDYTIGFDTAVNTVLGLISNLRDTCSSHERISIIEVMGRECGDLALHAGIAGGADVILVPEVKMSMDEVCRMVLESRSTGKIHSLIVKAEGADFDGPSLAAALQEMTGHETKVVVPGYIQRGGSPSLADRRLATLTAAKAVELLYEDSESRAIGQIMGRIEAVDLQEALAMKSEFDMDMYRLAGVLDKGIYGNR